MRGVVLAGGLGTRLRPLTSVTNKHLLPVYDRPMIFYPLEMLAEAGIEEVMIVVGGQSTEQIMKLCMDGRRWGFKSLYYVYQEGETGIAGALALTENFVNKDSVCVVLGDNIMLGDSLRTYKEAFTDGICGAMVLAAEVPDPQNYGVPTIEASGKKILFITEKPEFPQSKFGIIGVYFYDATLFHKIKRCAPSKRGELEITDVNNLYAEEGFLSWRKVKGKWIDAGSSIGAWIEAGKLVAQYTKEHEEFPELLQK
jgi:glucose-1-phosphate thymidylyltransferase